MRHGSSEIDRKRDTRSAVLVAEYSDDFSSQWSDYVDRCEDSTVAHMIGWRDVISRSLGHRPRYLMAMRGSTVVGILPLFVVSTWWRVKYVISIPWLDYGGVCADDKETARLLIRHATGIADEEGAAFLEMRSAGSNDLGLAERLDKASFVLELGDDPESIWKSFNAKLRNQIRKSQKSGLTVEIGGPEKLDSFYTVFSTNMRDLGTPVWGKNLFRNALAQFGSNAEIVVVKADDTVVAGGLILSFKDRQYVPSASSYRWSLKYCPNHALYWSVIERACKRGYSSFDFGRSSWNSGTFEFKRQWGAPPDQLVWQYHVKSGARIPKISPSNTKYATAIRIWKKMPLRLANFLGPKLIRNFP